MVRLTITLRTKAVRAAEETVEALTFLEIGTRIEPGCLGCSVWVEHGTTVQYVETWASEAHMRQRVLTEGFTTLLGVVDSADDADVRFEFVTATRGLEYVAEVRHHAR
jgi:quinol monooxygenase YgiN